MVRTMSGLLYTFRKHWKKSTLAAGVVCYGFSYGAQRYREYLIRREFCIKAKRFGDETCSPLDKPRRLYVILNPSAGDGKAVKLFQKNAGPLLYLAGIDVTYIQTEYEGHGKTILNYIDPTIDGIIAAGGDGTFAEVVTGMLRQSKNEAVKDIPVGFIPLGKSGNTIFNKVFQRDCCQVKDICNSTFAIIKGAMKKVDVMEVKASKRSVYAISSLHVGVQEQVKANIAAGKYWLLGRGKTYFAFIWRTVKDWPSSYFVQLSSLSSLSSLRSDSSSSSSSAGPMLLQTASCDGEGSDCIYSSSFSTDNNRLVVDHKGSQTIGTSSESFNYGLTLCSHSKDLQLETLGLSIYLQSGENGKNSHFRVQSWNSEMTRQQFISTGWTWMRNNFQPIESDCLETADVDELRLVPGDNQNLSYCIDGESFDAKPVDIRLHKDRINVFCP